METASLKYSSTSALSKPKQPPDEPTSRFQRKIQIPMPFCRRFADKSEPPVMKMIGQRHVARKKAVFDI